MANKGFRPQFFSREEELELYCRWRNGGDEEARRLLIESMYPLALSIAGKRKKKYPDTEAHEMNSAAGLACLEALDRFDPHRGVRLSTVLGFAVWARTTEDAWRTRAVKLPRHVATEEFDRLKRLFSNTEDCDYYSTFLSERPPGPLEEARQRLRDLLPIFKEVLNEREQDILADRLRGMTLREIGKKRQLTWQRISQIEQRAHQRIRIRLGLEEPKERSHV